MPYIPVDPTVITVSTKFGTLFLSINDVTEPKNKYIGHVTGTVVINRISVDVASSLLYRTRNYDKGREIEPVVELVSDYSSSYNRRTEYGANGNSLPDGVRSKLNEIFNVAVRTAYESSPELVKLARTRRLERDVNAATASVAEASEALTVAKGVLHDARMTLAVENGTI